MLLQLFLILISSGNISYGDWEFLQLVFSGRLWLFVLLLPLAEESPVPQLVPQASPFLRPLPHF